MLDSVISENYEEKRKSESLKKSSNFYLNSSTLYEKVKDKEAKKIWKKDSKTINNSILSLQIQAYENSFENVASDTLNAKNNVISTKEKFGSNKNQQSTRRIFIAASKFVFQNPFEFPRQQDFKVSEPEMIQFKASQRLLIPNKLTPASDSLPSPNRPENVLSKSTIPGYGENIYSGVISLPSTLKRDKNVVSGGYGIFFHRVIGKFYYTKSTNEPTWNRPNEVLLDDERRVLIQSFIEFKLEHANGNGAISLACLEYLKNLQLQPHTYLGNYFIGVDDDQMKGMISKACVENFIFLLDEKMLEKDENKKLKPTMSWEALSKLLNSDKRFYLMTRPSEKKAIFNKWKETADDREQRTKECEYEAFCKLFTENLSANKHFHSKLDYSAASEKFASEAFWNSVPLKQRKSVFEEVMKRIQKRIEGEEEKCREENIQSLTNMLKKMQNINCETTWAQAQQLLAQNPSFQKYLSFMDKDDALCVFSSHICELIDQYQKMEEQNEITKLRNERKNREKYQELLDEFRQSGIITLRTKWKDISPIICKEDIFKDLLLQSGPTPIDFFKFFMIDWNAEFKNNLDFVLELMNNKNFTFNLTTSYELFIAFIESNSKTSQVNKENYQYIYDSLFQDLIERTSKHENAKEKLRKTIVAQFRKLESNPNVKFRDIEAVLRYFKTKWNINKNVEGIVLKLHMEYLGQEDGELMYEKRDKRNYSNSYQSFNNSSEKERENQKRYHYSDREYNNKKKHHHHHHRHRSSSSEEKEDYHHHRRHRENPSSKNRNYQSYRKY